MVILTIVMFLHRRVIYNPYIVAGFLDEYEDIPSPSPKLLGIGFTIPKNLIGGKSEINPVKILFDQSLDIDDWRIAKSAGRSPQDFDLS